MMPNNDLYSAYRKIVASVADEMVACWYLGTLNAAVDGYPEIPIFRVATIMTYRAETLSPASCRIHWDEVGEFIDHTTGLPAESWLNPITGRRQPCVKGFREGDACYTVELKAEGLALSLHQPGAKIDSVKMDQKVEGDRIWINQTERKTRSLHGPGAQQAFTATTVLSLWSSRADVADASKTWAPASGSYSFTLNGLMPWMGFGDRKGKTMVRGVKHKSRTTEHVDPAAWDRLEKMYPEFFATLK